MWYLIANYNNKTYNLGAALNQECGALMMTTYYSCYDNKKVKIGLMRGNHFIDNELNQDRNIFSQPQFVKDYKRDHFMVAHLEMPDVSARFEC